MERDRPDTYWIVDPAQLSAMRSPRRHDIIDRLAASGPMSIRMLAAGIGAKPSALYHHIDKLLELGLVVEAGARVTRRKREQLYTTPAPKMRMARALAAGNEPALMAEIVGSLTRQMARDFDAGAASPVKTAEGEGRNYGFFRLVGRPSPAQLARINACLLEVSEILWKSGDSDGDLLCLGWVMAPIDAGTVEPE